MSIRTYYHDSPPGVISLPHNSLPPAPSDRMDALGWQLWMLRGDNIEKQAAEIAIRAGYTRPTNNFTISAMGTIETKMTARLQASKDHYTATVSSVALVIAGEAHFDIEDPIESKWIRVIVKPGLLMHMPQGAHTRVAFEDPDWNIDIILWFNENVPPSDIDWIKGQDTHGHPVRLNYLNELGTHR
ncbi:hypothetical protein EV360DRAFT_89270 [Lentinula raphanica]|nr:hypothetical protein EV360DRAFT_89270 [Lentinula raphanica]